MVAMKRHAVVVVGYNYYRFGEPSPNESPRQRCETSWLSVCTLRAHTPHETMLRARETLRPPQSECARTCVHKSLPCKDWSPVARYENWIFHSYTKHSCLARDFPVPFSETKTTSMIGCHGLIFDLAGQAASSVALTLHPST
jgi:hypothetical protein